MAETAITNCHIHTFTTAHAPAYYPMRPVALFRLFPGLVSGLRWAARFQPWERIYDTLFRLENFHRTGRRLSQRDVLLEVLRYYPGDTRFVVLPMDMALIGHGPVRRDIGQQHAELHALTKDPDFGHRIIPFATIHPDRADGIEEFRRCVEEYGFRGLKIYPKLGYAPDHPVLMRQVYPICEERGLPVISHCSRGGVRHKRWTQEQADQVTRPDACLPVLSAFPQMKLCLAHFGGDQEWRSYLTDGFDPLNPEARKANWVSRIADMIRSGDYPTLYTDISYTIFKFADYIPLLRLFLNDPRLRTRILFGSDFYMTRQEALSEKAISIRLRDALGEDGFRQIAETNPRDWLGDG
jgi:predicted TIM-barrel fold metal-dependent hydrolase